MKKTYSMEDSITFTPEQLEILFENNSDWKTPDPTNQIVGFENWYLEVDHQTGKYDSGKCSMVDYEISLYNPYGDCVGLGKGGYYNSMSGDCFNYDITFYPIVTGIEGDIDRDTEEYIDRYGDIEMDFDDLLEETEECSYPKRRELIMAFFANNPVD